MTNNTMQRRIYAPQRTRAYCKFSIAKKYVKAGLIGMCVLGMYNKSVAQTSASPVKNIVLVHGAWVDGSGWKPVYDILVKDGYTVTLVQEPLTSFAEDVRATKRVLDQQQGPCILVGHSYGGSVITEAGTDPHVVGLVYIAAHMPDTGESEAADGERYPSAVSEANVIEKSSDGFIYLNRAEFPKYFAADLPKEQAEFEAQSQIETAATVFMGKITTPAWRSKPSWMLVAKADLIINPDLERWYAQRAHSHTVEVDGASHSVYESHPEEVAALIEDSAHQSRSRLLINKIACRCAYSAEMEKVILNQADQRAGNCRIIRRDEWHR